MKSADGIIIDPNDPPRQVWIANNLYDVIEVNDSGVAVLYYGDQRVHYADFQDIYIKEPLHVNDAVKRVGSDYTFNGHVVAVFNKYDNGPLRFVVQDDRGVLFIMNRHNLELR